VSELSEPCRDARTANIIEAQLERIIREWPQGVLAFEAIRRHTSEEHARNEIRYVLLGEIWWRARAPGGRIFDALRLLADGHTAREIFPVGFEDPEVRGLGSA
jgi:hypothetical protein